MSLADEVQERFHLAREAYPQGELEFMCETVEDVRPDGIWEWGTGSGASGRIFWEATEIVAPHGAIYSFDLPDELSPLEAQHPRERTGQYLAGTGVFAGRGDGVTMALSQWTQGAYERPLFFIDGDHSYFAVYREIALIDRMVPNAVMLLHDTNDGPGLAGEKWVADQGRHTYRSIQGRTGIGRLDPL